MSCSNEVDHEGVPGATLIIDTSFGSTVGLLGGLPLVEKDSKSHVEHLQVNIGRVMSDAGLGASDLAEIVVGVGPAPFTGLRTGIVTAKALAYATGARLLGQDILEPQARWSYVRKAEVGKQAGSGGPRRLTLSVNDARRRQLYFSLYDDFGDGREAAHVLIPMDIDYPDAIVARVSQAVQGLKGDDDRPIQVDLVGYGAGRYAAAWPALPCLGGVDGGSCLEAGADGLEMFVRCARRQARGRAAGPVEPLYLRRPDVSVPNPLKRVMQP